MAEAGADRQEAWAAVVINWNGAADLPACLPALAGQTRPPAEIVVVDNASADDSLTVLRDFPHVRVLASPTNLGFAGGANAGIRATTAPLVATFNPDVTLDPTWAEALLPAFAADPRLGAAGGKLLYPDHRTIQHAGGRIERPLLVGPNIGRGEPDDGQYDTPAEVDFVTGGAMMLRRTAVEDIGHFDEGFYPAYYEDLDLCVRLRAASWAVRYIPAATGVHRESAAVDARSPAYYRMIHAGRLRFAAKALSLRELVAVFLPAELARLTATLQHLRGPQAADEAGLSVFPAALLGRSRATPTAAPPSQPLLTLAPPDHSPAASPTAPSLAPTVDPRPLVEQVAEVGRRWLVEERPFTSTAPLLAPVIVWLRTQLNNAGPRWHVKQILSQQVEFNAAVNRALAGAAAEAQAARLGQQASSAVLAESIEALAVQQAELLARLQALEQRLAALDEAGLPHNQARPADTDDVPRTRE